MNEFKWIKLHSKIKNNITKLEFHQQNARPEKDGTNCGIIFLNIASHSTPSTDWLLLYTIYISYARKQFAKLICEMYTKTKLLMTQILHLLFYVFCCWRSQARPMGARDLWSWHKEKVIEQNAVKYKWNGSFISHAIHKCITL